MVSVPTWPTSTRSKGVFDLGDWSPEKMRWLMGSQALLAAGIGLLSGRNWQEGLAQGFAGAGQAVTDTRDNMMRDRLYGFEFKKYQDEETRQQAEDERKRHLGEAVKNYRPPPGGRPLPFDPEFAQYLTPDEQFDVMKQAWAVPKAQTGVAQAKADFDAGLITQAQLDAITKKETYIAPQQPQQPTEFQSWRQQFKVDNNRYPNAKEIAGWRKDASSTDWQTGKGQEGVDFRYNARTGETNLARKSGGFYSLDEVGGQIPTGMPLVPRVKQPGGGPAFDWGQYKGGGGDVTPAQSANNAEIDAARKYLANTKIPMADIAAKSQPLGPDGFTPNPDYDPFIAQTFRNAMQHKVGEDSEFDSVQQQYRGGGSGGVSGDGGEPAIGQSPALTGSGTQTDPYVPQSEADFQHMEPGEYYVDPGDGQIYQFVQ